jgi:hypothetical protein
MKRIFLFIVTNLAVLAPTAAASNSPATAV